MKFSIKFYQGCRTLSKADEIIIQYKQKSANLMNFVQRWGENKRIVIDITELNAPIEECSAIFKQSQKLHEKFAVLMSHNQNYAILAENNIPFFFIEGVTCFDDLSNQIKLGVSDVYIVNELGFHLERISDFCHKNNVQIRVFPNVVQSGSKINADTFNQFFIRPNAVPFYEDFVDIFEFFGPLDRQPVLYDIYQAEEWLGDLNEIILGLDKEINNQSIMPYFDTLRINCKKNCNFNKCGICESIGRLGKALEENEIKIIKKRINNNEHKINEANLSNESRTAIDDDANISKEETV